MLFKHSLRNALIPIVTVAAIELRAADDRGLIVTENIFNYPGMGKYFLDAVMIGDFLKLLPFLVILTTSVIVFNLISDVAGTPTSTQGSASTDRSLHGRGPDRGVHDVAVLVALQHPHRRLAPIGLGADLGATRSSAQRVGDDVAVAAQDRAVRTSASISSTGSNGSPR